MIGTVMDVTTWHDVLSEPERKPLKFAHDPVAVSVANWRTSTSWDIKEAQPTAEDIAVANNIRAYYGHKLMMQRLRGIEVSPFRAKLGAFLVGNHTLVEGEQGLLYRLPFFYAEDCAIDQCVLSTTSAPERNTHETTQVLRPLMRIYRARRTGNGHWFVFENHQNELVMFCVRLNEPLWWVMDSLHKKPSVALQAKTWYTEPVMGHSHRYWTSKTFGLT